MCRCGRERDSYLDDRGHRGRSEGLLENASDHVDIDDGLLGMWSTCCFCSQVFWKLKHGGLSEQSRSSIDNGLIVNMPLQRILFFLFEDCNI